MKSRHPITLLAVPLIAASMLLFAGCEDEGPIEEAVEEIDQEGPVEETADEVEEAAEETADEVEEAADEVEEELDQ